MKTLKNLLLLGGLVMATSCDQIDDFIGDGGGDDDGPIMEMQPLTSSVVPDGVFTLKGEFNSDLSQNLNLNDSSKASLDIESGVVEMRNNKLIILVD